MRKLTPFFTSAVVILLAACSSSAQQTRHMSPDAVVASVGGTSITLEQVDVRALQQSASSFGGARLVQALYIARRAVLEEMVADALLDVEAKSRGIDRDKLVELEITSKVTAPTTADIEFWYQTNPDRVQGRPLDLLRDAIQAFLTTQRSEEARDVLINTLKTKTPVTISLEPPRQQVASAGHATTGPATAPIEIVEFSDFQCPFCQQAHPTVKRVLSTYGDKVRLVYRHYPLPNHPNAQPAAEAAECADTQGKFWEYHDRLFSNPSRLSDADLKEHAAALGLDMTKFGTCFDSHEMKTKVERDFQDGELAGVSGTPAFFVNGRQLEGAQPFEAFKRIIDEELSLKK